MKSRLSALSGCIAILATFAPARADSVAEFYRGRQIEIIVGSEAGTSYDSWARLLAQNMPKYVPGQPSFIVRDMPGAGHIKATNYLYAVAPRDGTSIGVLSDLMPVASVLKNRPGLEADFTKLRFVGATDRNELVCVARGDAPVQNGADLFTRELTVGGAGAGSGISTMPAFLKETLGMRFKVVEGYKSSVDVMLAIERSEVDGMCQTYQGVLHGRPDAFARGALRLLFNMAVAPIPDAGAPSVHQFIKNDMQRAIVTFYSLNAELGRPTIAPPGLPSERLDALRVAFEQTVRDSQFLADAMKQNLGPNPVSAAEMENIFGRIVATPADVTARAAKFM